MRMARVCIYISMCVYACVYMYVYVYVYIVGRNETRILCMCVGMWMCVYSFGDDFNSPGGISGRTCFGTYISCLYVLMTCFGTYIPCLFVLMTCVGTYIPCLYVLMTCFGTYIPLSLCPHDMLYPVKGDRFGLWVCRPACGRCRIHEFQFTHIKDMVCMFRC